MRLLVVGAAPNSLGAAIVDAANRETVARLEIGGKPMEVITAGIGNEDRFMDVTGINDIWDALLEIQPSHVIVTAGINVGDSIGGSGYLDGLRKSLWVNTVGVMSVLDAWIALKKHKDLHAADPFAFVAISSNSAHIARTGSTAYCASKAALSMAIRCAARELQGSPLVYGYEFGLLAGTPMTAGTEARFGSTQTRMPGAPKGLNVFDAANQIVNDLLHPWQGLNGALMRFDSGEQ